MIPELVDSLLRAVRDSSVSEIEYESDKVKLRILREVRCKAEAGVRPPTSVSGEQALEKLAGGPEADRVSVHAPMHGTFYRSSSPGEPPMVEVGQMVQAGQQLALLEAMKMLHAVEAEHEGRVVQIFVENGTFVEPGMSLFELETVGNESV